MSWVTTEVATVAPELVSNEFHVKTPAILPHVLSFAEFNAVLMLRILVPPDSASFVNPKLLHAAPGSEQGLPA